jgi:glycerophosphoryl diester phosphodiesterase
MNLRTWILAMAILPAAAATPGIPDGPINIAHRGASGHAPEHTFASWDLARTMGAHYLEQDLQMTADGVLVVLHDETLDRTARGPAVDCTGSVREKTLEQLRRCEVGSWFNERFPDRARPEYADERIPTLEEVFQRYGTEVRYYIETKQPEEAPGMEEALLDLLDRYGLTRGAEEEGQVLIQSFSPGSLRLIHDINPRLPLIQLLGSREHEILPLLDGIREYAVGIGPNARGVTPEVMAAAKARGLLVHPYTVNEPVQMRALLELGVDGMFTDHPDRLAEILAEG